MNLRLKRVTDEYCSSTLLMLEDLASGGFEANAASASGSTLYASCAALSGRRLGSMLPSLPRLLPKLGAPGKRGSPEDIMS